MIIMTNVYIPGVYRWKSGLAGSAEYEAPTLTSQITCTRCGGGGHIASDCKVDL